LPCETENVSSTIHPDCDVALIRSTAETCRRPAPRSLAEQLKDETSPVEALRRWLHSDIELVATKKGMAAALALAVHGPSELYAESLERLAKAVGVLLDRAVAAGEIRSDISPKDLLRALVGMCYMHDQPGWQASVLRLVDIFVDGLRLPVKISKANHAGAAKRARTKRD
jgi:hypothetical protein